MSARDLHFANSAITVTWQGELAGQLVDFVFGAVPARGPAVPHATLRLSQADGGLFYLSGPENIDTFRGDFGQMGVRLMERACFHLADRSQGGLLLHAASLIRNGKSLLLPGVSGSGKSTLAIWLALHGFHYQTDELVYLQSGTWDCQALARPVYLKKSAERIEDGVWRELLEKTALPAGSGWLVPPPALGYSSDETGAAAGIVFVRYQAGATFEFEHLPAADGAVLLAGLLLNARNLPGNGFSVLVRLAREIPVYRMIYGSFQPVCKAIETIYVDS